MYDWTVKKNHEKWHVDEKTGQVIVPKSVAEHKADLDRSKLHAQYILAAVKKEAERT